ncbi:TetR/AcrR family transcriptional regulator [Amycolatopsis anabasis]|uniref:TetR/AcrR family transcriptional regulator n=1 Tax=Amycolatopsis anabasis TaxID=1840409 RepID=UPI00131C876F|nr:TetR family transcriptional regulator [Amycolatopsis anabasis]
MTAENDTSGLRQRILDAAAMLFFRRGFRATSVKQITEECGITPGAMYTYFPSKEDVLFTLIIKATEDGEKLLADAMAQAVPEPADQLHALVKATALYHTRHRALGMLGTLQYHELPAAQREAVVERRKHFRGIVEQVLRAGVREGVFTLPPVTNRNAYKAAATAVINVAIRATDVFGPTTEHWGAEETASFYADLAVRMVSGGPR